MLFTRPSTGWEDDPRKRRKPSILLRVEQGAPAEGLAPLKGCRLRPKQQHTSLLQSGGLLEVLQVDLRICTAEAGHSQELALYGGGGYS